MINGLEGIPGSGKSYEAVVFHVLAALKSGRKVITNLPLNIEAFGGIDPAFPDLIEVRKKPSPVLGTWDVTRVDDAGNGSAFELFPVGHIPDQVQPVIYAGSNSRSSFVRGVPDPDDVHTFGSVWDFYDTFRAADGRGALFVIDECHNPFPKLSTDRQVVQWFKLHRHFNADVLLMTQNFRDMNQPISGLIAMLIKVRKADILGRKDSYIRKVYSGYRGAVISTDERKYLPQYFKLYKSHTQGNSVAESAASDVAPFIVKWRRFSWGFYFVTAVVMLYAFWPKAKPVPVFHESVQKQLKQNSAAPVVPVLSGQSSSKAVLSSVPVVEPVQVETDPEPLRDKMVHIVGWAKFKGRTIYSFAVSASGQRLFDLQNSDLVASGYIWKPLSECMGYLTYKNVVRTVTCDPPALSRGTSVAPIVVADGSRRSSAERPSSALPQE